MSNIITFGKYEGRTFEWLFFNAPGYVEWMFRNRIHRQRYNFEDEVGDEFAELFRRARCLHGICPRCRERPITRMSLSFCERFAGASHVNFLCDECEHISEGPTLYSTASFFADYELSVDEEAAVAKCIKNHFIGIGKNLTQAKMEEFFRNDANFVHATPGFFAKEVAAI